MAFNPFHGFRKHQKTIITGIVILCMVVFILTGFAGDITQRLQNWFGGGRAKGQLVATLNGTKIYESDLARQLRLRGHAASFLGYASMQDAPPTNPNNMVAGLATLNGRVRLLFQSGQSPFGGSSTTEGQLDFILWKQQADKLGFVITEADLKREVNRVATTRDLFGGKNFITSTMVQTYLANFRSNDRQSITPEELQEALIDEYRVLLAKEALLGEPGPSAFTSDPFGFSGFGAQDNSVKPSVTPYDFLQYYREQRTTLNVWMLPVAIEDFIAQAKKNHPSPPEEELRRLYEQYRDIEPKPTDDRPGFKEPGVRLDWLVATSDLPYFRTAAHTKIVIAPQVTRITMPAGVFTWGGPGAAAASVALPLLLDDVKDAYTEYERRERSLSYDASEGYLRFHDAHWRHPETASAMAGFFMGAARSPLLAPGIGSALQALSGGVATVVAHEDSVRNRLLGAQMMMLLHPPVIGSPGVSIPLLPILTTAPLKSKEEAASLLTGTLEAKQADEAIDIALTTLRDELTKLKSDETAAKKKLDEAVAKYGFRRESMKRLMDKYELDRDDSIKVLREAYQNHSLDANLPQTFTAFAQETLKGLYLPQKFDDPESTDRQLRVLSTTAKTRYLVWQVETTKARTPQNLAEARKNVEAAWYYQVARNLARKEAETLNKRLRDLKGKDAKSELAKDPALAKYVRDSFTLTEVSRLRKDAGAGGAGRNDYKPYVVETSKIAFARPKMVDQLLSLKEPGDTMTLSDLPEAHYYVAVLESRNNRDYLNPREKKEFDDAYNNAGMVDPLWKSHLMPERREDFYKRFLNQLRVESGAAVTEPDENGRIHYKLPDGVRPRAGDPGSDD